MTLLSIDQWLTQHGLLLCAFSWQTLPESITEITRKALPDVVENQCGPDTRLLLLANAGPGFWRRMRASSAAGGSDPVDEFSVTLARSFQAAFLDGAPFTQLYPTPAHQSHIPLMRLGGLAGWNIPSPLGLGLHTQYGPWTAYRAAWLTHAVELPSKYVISAHQQKHTDLNALQDAAELCTHCAAPCADACPAGAVQHGKPFNTELCFQHRQPVGSECHVHCAARRACPVGQEHQYDDDQLAYHMGMRWRTR